MQSNQVAQSRSGLFAYVSKLAGGHQTFRWRMIPAALTYMVAFCQLAVAAIIAFSWIEYWNSDRYDAARPLYLSLLETLQLFVLFVASAIAFESGWSWTRRGAAHSFFLLLFSVYLSLMIFMGR